MNKSLKYTVLTIFLAFIFAFGSIAGMNVILEAREDQILTESGRAVVETPVRAWDKQVFLEEEENGGNFASAQERYVLTMKQMEEAVSCWDNRVGVTVHNPVNGQISMEEAVGAGEEWLMEMELLENEKDMEAYFVNAMLGIAAQKEEAGVQLEPYYSFWTVRFLGEAMNAVLYINAVTGNVLGAEISLYGNLPVQFPVENLKRFAELAGLQENDAEIVFDPDGTLAFLEMADSPLCAEMELQRRQKRYIDLNQ